MFTIDKSPPKRAFQGAFIYTLIYYHTVNFTEFLHRIYVRGVLCLPYYQPRPLSLF